LTDIKTIGVLAHPLRPNTAPIAQNVAKTLEACGVQTWVYTVWDANSVQADVQSADVVIAIGGDGAMLRAARVGAPYAVPVLGINMGRLGFLTEIARTQDWDKYLDRLLKGDYWIEKRMMLTAQLWRGQETLMSADALNDVVVSGDSVGRIVQLDTYIDNDWATTYNSDALIVATPTGSTAYALAAGGPILPPDLLSILLVPSAPHLSMDRPIVLSEGATVDIQLACENCHHAIISVDGTIIADLEPADRVRIQASQHCAHFVRMRSKNYFYRSLLDRMEPRVSRSHRSSLFDQDDI